MVPGCGALRPYTPDRRAKCRGAARVRRAQEGDVVPLSDGARAAEAASACDPRAAADEPPEAYELQADVPQLPANFRARLKQLSSNTMLHIPPQFCHHMCSITARSLEGSNEGSHGPAMLEEACAKLLLAHMPRGSSSPQELRVRIGLWEDGSYI